MTEPTADEPLPPADDTNPDSDVRHLLREIRRASQNGMLTWTLQKKVEADPSCSISLINVLLNELEKKQQRVCKTQKFKSYMSIMPVLHTLYYVVIQSGVTIPNSLYQRVSECLTKLLILPLPYSAVVQQTLRSISMEMITPGCLYQTRVIAEQNIKNEHFNLQEKVFVLADPAVFSASLESTLRAYLDVSDSLRNTHMVERKVVLHVLCSGLETACQNTNLARALEALDNKTARKYFHDVVLAVSQSTNHGAGGRADYLNTLQEIYQRITSGAEERTEAGRGSLCNALIPYPKINFLLWNDEEDLWNLLTQFTLQSCLSSGKDEDDSNKRDSGIEKDINDQGNTTLPFNRQSALKRRNAYRTVKSAENLDLVKEKIEGSSGSSAGLKEERSHTARVVVLGDDRALGRLARAYSSMREKESKRNMLTKKLNLQLYYIPVSDVKPSLQPPESSFLKESSLSLASHLGRVDPWYNSDISNLGAAISNLSEMPTNTSGPSELNLFLLDSLCYYLRCGTQSVNLPLYSVKMFCSTSGVNSVVEDVFVSHLEADIPDFRHLKKKKETSKAPSSRSRKITEKPFGAVLSVRYTKASLSKRQIVRGEAPMTCGVVITSEPADSTSGEDYLKVSFDSVNPENNEKIQTKSINIKTLEHWALCVCLDRDSRRIYNNIQRLEIFPCLDPGCKIKTRLSMNASRELPLSRYLDQVLSLPINTFTGASS
ncbi:phosphoinositide 3-kinase regulatory subunit 6 [Salarias fasciatus]|uniref:phosphoinositide 3-kinase regulatory subunit 6 n=1 Tax=Salarias fasciatus TaxID=181472 RepID=UPI0011766BCC|nr:phosphoinositide 3-kinase regulatory subunit 6-like [Salarias fasciatus]